MNGEILKELRKDAGMSQEDLARALSLSASSIKAYEQGRNTPSDEIKVQIAKLFNRSLDYLLGATPLELPFQREESIDLPQGFPKSEIPKVIDYIDLIMKATKESE